MDPLAGLAALDELGELEAPTEGRPEEEEVGQCVQHGGEEGTTGTDLVAMAGLLGKRRQHGQRSWQLMQHARDAKKLRKQEEELEEERKKRQRAETIVNVLAASSSTLARSLGLRPGAPLDIEVRCKLRMKLAIAPTSHGAPSKGFARAQGQSAIVLGTYLEQAQQQEVCQMLWPVESALPGGLGFDHDRIAMFVCQWDETSQMMRPMRARDLPSKLAQGRSHAGAQMMVISGGVHVHGTGGPDSLGQVAVPLRKDLQWFSRSWRLECQDADSLLEGLLRSLPFNLEDTVETVHLLAENSVFIFAACVDRAKQNFCALRWMCDQVFHKIPCTNLLCHVEPCALHGVALVRSRGKVAKQIASALYSFTRWVRIFKNRDALVRTLFSLIKTNLQIRRERRPEEDMERNRQILESVCGDLTSSEYLWNKPKHGGPPQKKPLLLTLEAVRDTVSVDLVTYNFVEEDSDDHLVLGKAVGSPITEDRRELEDLAATPLLDFLSARAWATATESRWTNVYSVLRRFVIGSSFCRLMPRAPTDLQVKFSASESLEASLLKLIRQDAKDFTAKSKLRLVRICKVLFADGVLMDLAVMVVAGAPSSACKLPCSASRGTE